MARRGAIAVLLLLPVLRTMAQVTTLATEKNVERTSKPTPKPSELQLEPFQQLAHGLRSGPIVIVDQKTFFIPNLHYDGKGPDAHFWVGTGPKPGPSGILVPDENNCSQPLPAYTGQNIYIRLPGELTVDKIDYLAMWCIKFKHNFGHVLIPKNVDVPLPGLDPELSADNKTVIRIQKCCPRDQVLLTSGCTASNHSFEPKIEVHTHNSTHINDEPLTAQAIEFKPFSHRISCEHKQFPLIPGEDNFVLLQNGSLIVIDTEQFLSQDQYCMETVNFGDEKDSSWVTTAIICFSSGEVPTSSALFVVYAIGVLISALFLIITALVFLVVKEVRDARGKCVVGYSVSMAAAFICLAFAQILGIDDNTCNTFGFIIQFFLVSSFTWLTMVSWETYFKIRKYNKNAYTSDRKRLYIYMGFGIAAPVMTLIISVIVDNIPDLPNTFLKPHFGKNSCWFDQKKGSMLYFYFPIGLAIFFNIILGVLMKWKLVWFQKYRQTDISWRTTRNELKPMFRSCIFLLIVNTLCWLMEVISFLSKSEGGVWIAIDIINSLQGLIVFLIFVLHRPVKDKICRFSKRQPEEQPMTELRSNGFAPSPPVSRNYASNTNGEFLTNLRHADSVEDLT